MKNDLEELFLERLRLVCLGWPETKEVKAWGHPNFKAGKQTFAVLETYKGMLSLAVKVNPSRKSKLSHDSRFYETPYIGKKGWLSLKIDETTMKTWDEIEQLLLESYKNVAHKRMLSVLEES